MSIPFTQYLLPDGHRKEVYIERPPAVEALAQAFIADGGRFECEMLRDMATVSLTAVHSIPNVGGGDVAMVLCKNGPEIPGAVDKLVQKATDYMKEMQSRLLSGDGMCDGG